MDDATAEDIARIEARIEQLAFSIERCRKLSLAAKIAIAAGAAWIVLTLLWIVPFVPAMVFTALAAVIGGLVLLGSNATTWTQTEAALRASEALRAEMIERLALRTVDAGVREVH
jgi:hypothetical protein